MKNWKTCTLNVNGLTEQAVYNEETVQEVFLPLLRKLTAMWKKKGERLIVFMAAPPAAGKSTLSLFLEDLSKTCDDLHPIQSIGLDGYHYHSDYIASHFVIRNGEKVPMKLVKGCAETFDAEHLREKLKELQRGDTMWPVYDRIIHDVIEDQVRVTGDIVLLEGNWLLLKDDRWKDIRSFADYTIMIRSREEFLKERLIGRKMQGGSSREEAEAFYERSDAANIIRVLEDSQKADYELFAAEDNDYRVLVP